MSRHPKGHNYRVGVKDNRIEVYERVGPDVAELVNRLAGARFRAPGLLERLRADQGRSARFTRILRFILRDAYQRIYGVQRMCYLGSIDDWIDLYQSGPVG